MSAQNFSMRFMLAVLAVVALASTASAFVPTSSQVGTTPFASSQVVPDISGTQLSERRWNFNEGQSPWGMKTNAETWNGRVAQVCCVTFCSQKRSLPDWIETTTQILRGYTESTGRTIQQTIG